MTFRSVRRWPKYFGAAVVVFSFSQHASAQQQQTIFCLADGTKIGATRFETHEGRFLLHVAGSATPLEYPASSIKGINVDPCPVAAAPVVRSAANAPSAVAPDVFGVHGSNTIGERLMPMLIEAYAKQRLGAAPTVRLKGGEEQEILLKSPNGARVAIDLQAHGSGTAAKGLVEGRAAIGMSSRRLNPDEARSIEGKFRVDALAPGNEHVLALDGLTVIVNPANPVQTLSLEQVARIFSGQIVNWSQVGGADRQIRVLRRDNKSGTFDTFKALVLTPFKLDVSAAARAFESSEALSEQVSRDPDAIGFVGLPYVNRNVAVSIASSCGITSSPSKFSIKTEEYPLARRLYLYTIGAISDPTLRELLQFTLSDQAQSTIQEAEFVEQAVVFQDEEQHKLWAQAHIADPRAKTAPKDVFDEFRRLTAATRRSSIVLRFREGSVALDTKAMQDADRLVRYLRANLPPGKRFFIVGFADRNGGWSSNLKLALLRAQQVADVLKRSGLNVPKDAVKTFSYLAPSACDDTEAGAAKNRRVELWVAK